MKQVIVFPRGDLTDLDKSRMDEAGIIAVESDEPSKVVHLVPGSSLLNADDMLMSALWEIKTRLGGEKFVAELYRRLSEKEKS